ncbi:MAG TPA: response regulator [Acetobacteraceae bacterium]|nr:response regulator [Acetobacteraceae bacterium]
MPEGPERPRVLVVEDEAMIAMLIEDMLEELGYAVAMVAGRLQTALQAVEAHNFDVAIVDVNIAGQTSYPVADRLTARGIPFAFVTGYGSNGLAEAYAAIPVLQKPFRIADLTQLMQRLLTGAG